MEKLLVTLFFTFSFICLNAQELQDSTEEDKLPELSLPEKPKYIPVKSEIDNKINFPDQLSEIPSFPSGREGLIDYLTYHLKDIKPSAKYRLARKAVSIKVFFVVEKDGSVSDVNIPKRYSSYIDNKDIEKIKKAFQNMPHWNPGKLLDEPKRTKMIQSIQIQ